MYSGLHVMIQIPRIFFFFFNLGESKVPVFAETPSFGLHIFHILLAKKKYEYLSMMYVMVNEMQPQELSVP